MSILSAVKTLGEAKQAITLFSVLNTAFPKLTKLGSTLKGIATIFTANGIASGFKAISTSIASLSKLGQIGLAIGAVAVTIAGITAAMDKWVYTYDENIKKAQEYNSEVLNTQQEQENVNQQLESNSSRIDELLAKKNRTLAEDDELTKLNQENQSLERQNKILEINEKSATAKRNTQLENTLTQKQIKESFWGEHRDINPDYIEHTTADVTSGSYRYKALDVIDAINLRTEAMKKLKEDISDVEEQLTNDKLSDKEREKLEKNLSSLESDYDGYLNYVQDRFQEIEDGGGIDAIQNSALKTKVIEAYDDLDEVLGTSGKSSQSIIEGSLAKYDNVKEELVALAKQGKLSADTLKNSFGAFYKEVTGKGVDVSDILQYIQAIADPESYNFSEVKRQFKNDVKDLGSDAQKEIDNLSEEQLTAYMAIKASDMDTSGWDWETWKKEIEERANEAVSSIKLTPKLDAYEAALESANSGANYDKIYAGIKTAKDAYDNFETGTDDFKTFTALISPNDLDTVEEYERCIGKIQRYFTEDISGSKNFLKDLDAQGLVDFNEATGEVVGNITDVNAAAQKMGLSTEVLVALFQKLRDYNIETGIFDNASEAKSALDDYVSDYSELVAQRDKLLDSGVKADDSQIKTLNDKISELKGNIETTTDSYFELLSGGSGSLEESVKNEEIEKQVKNDSLAKLLGEYNSFDWGSTKFSTTKKDTRDALDVMATELGGYLEEQDGKLTFKVGVEIGDTTAVENKVADLKYQISEDNQIELTAVDKTGETIQSIQGKVNSITDSTITITAQDGTQYVVDTINNKITSLNPTVTPKVGAIDTSAVTGQNIFVNVIGKLIGVSNPANLTAQSQGANVNANVTGIDKVQQLNTEISKVNDKTSNVNANVTGINAVSSLVNKLNQITNRNSTVTVNTYENKTITTTYKKGKDSLYGNAFAQGGVGEKSDVTSLIGEVAPEMVVRGNRWFTVDNPQFMKLKKGDIVFNGRQTAELLKNGSTASYGKAMLEGNARANVTLSGSNRGFSTLASSSSSSSNSSSKSASSSKSSDSSKSSSKKSTEAKTNDNYYNYFDAMLTDREKFIEQFEKELERLNTKIETALEDNDLELYKDLENQFNAKSTEYRNYLSDSAEEFRKIAEQQIYPAIYKIAPELKGQTIDTWSESTMLDIQKRIDDKIIALENSGSETKEVESHQKELEELKGSISDWYEAVGSENGEGDWADKWLDSWNEQKDNALKLFDDIQEGYEEKLNFATPTESIELLREEAQKLQEDLDFDVSVGYIKEGSDEFNSRAEAIRDTLYSVFDSIDDKYERQLDTISDAYTDINNQVSLIEANEYEANDAITEQLIENKKQENEILRIKEQELKTTLEQLAVQNKLTDEERYEIEREIRELEETIADNDIDIAENIKSLDEYDRHVSIFEKTVERLKDAFDKLGTLASSTYKSFTSKSNSLKSEATQLKNIINQTNTELAYTQKLLDDLNLSSDILEAIKSGTIDYKAIDDVELSETVQKAIGYYDTILELQGDSIDYAEQLSSIYTDMFDNVADKYNAMLNQIELNANLIDKSISITEAQGYLTSTNYYDALKSLEETKLSDLEQEKVELTKAMQTAVSSGNIEKYSSAWLNMQSDINDVTTAIYESKAALIDYENQIRELNWETFDYLQETISEITEETDFLVDLMSNSDLFDDNGNITDTGMATLGLYGVDYNTSMEQAKKYAQEIEQIENDIANDEYNTDLLERRQELIQAQRDSILAAEDAKQSIKDLVSDGYDKELDALQDLIDKYEDMLDSQEDLYEYQQDIRDQTSDIAKLRKQLAAYANDTTEETKAKVQELKVDLEEAEEELAETQYKQFISDTKKLLSNLYDDFEEALNSRLDNIDTLISNVITSVNSDSANIMNTLQTVSDSVGYTLSDSMTTIWTPITDEAGEIKDVLTTYSGNVANSMTTLQTAVENIVTGINDMITATNNLANNNISSASYDSSQVATSSGSSSAVSTGTTVSKGINTGTSTSASSTSKTPQEQFESKYPASKRISGVFTDYVTGRQAVLASGKLTSGNPKVYFLVKRSDGYHAAYLQYGDDKVQTGTILKGAYASGTKYNTTSGAYLVDENGEELITHNSNGRVTSLEVGDKVYTSGETSTIADNLDALSSLNLQALADKYSTISYADSVGNYASTPYTYSVASIDGLLKNIAGSVVQSKSESTGDINSNNDYTFNVNIPIEKVQDYQDFMYQMQHDDKFEKMVVGMTIGKSLGVSQLDKYKYKFK